MQQLFSSWKERLSFLLVIAAFLKSDKFLDVKHQYPD